MVMGRKGSGSETAQLRVKVVGEKLMDNNYDDHLFDGSEIKTIFC
jgi:hypothetical protein